MSSGGSKTISLQQSDARSTAFHCLQTCGSRCTSRGPVKANILQSTSSDSAAKLAEVLSRGCAMAAPARAGAPISLMRVIGCLAVRSPDLWLLHCARLAKPAQARWVAYELS